MPSRRDILGGAAGGLITARIAGHLRWVTPAEAADAGAPFAAFTTEEAALLGAIASVLVVDAEKLGVVHYIDYHVAIPPAQSLLILRYLDVAPPYLDFYRQGLASLRGALRHRGIDRWDRLDIGAQETLIADMRQANPPGWDGPPAPLFSFALRSDAVDVVYGTEAGFARLGVPYLPHIAPPAPW